MVYVRYKSAQAAQVIYKYTEVVGGVTTDKSVSFIISTNTNYTNGVPISSNITESSSGYTQTLVDIVNKSSNTVVGELGSPVSAITEALDSIDTSNTTFVIDVKKLYTNVKNVAATGHTANSLQFKFLNTAPTIVEFAMYTDGFNLTSQKEMAYQFHKYVCQAFDSAQATTDSVQTSGLGSAKLETYTAINKSLPDLFDYSLFVGGGINGAKLDGYQVIINK
jgi:hypothetical protein